MSVTDETRDPAVTGTPGARTGGIRGMRIPTLGGRRDHAERYLMVTVAAFAISVAATRWFLASTGYPKVGGGGLHIAHMLWGGLLLVVASILPLLFVGRRVLYVSALAGGIGVGLFIDEVGKFITESNDYFFAPAAPLIYGALLLLVTLWAVVRRGGRRRASATDALHAAAEALGDAADGTLTRERRDAVVARLAPLTAATDPDHAGLAASLSAALAAPGVEARLVPAGWLDGGGPVRLLERLLPTRLERWLALGLLGLTALLALFSAGLLLALLGVGPVPPLPQTGPVEFPSDPVWLYALLAVAVGVGIASGVALVLVLAGREDAGLRLGTWATLANLVAGGLLTFYVAQFEAMGSVVLHLVILGLLVDLARRRRNATA